MKPVAYMITTKTGGKLCYAIRNQPVPEGAELLVSLRDAVLQLAADAANDVLIHGRSAVLITDDGQLKRIAPEKIAFARFK